MHGFVNEQSSCYMDALLVALFVPRYNDVFVKLFFDSTDQLHQQDGAETAWEKAPRCVVAWRLQVRDQLLTLVQNMHANTSTSLTVAPLKRYFKQVPMGSINFGHHEQQSAVDFLRYLLNVFRVRDALVSFQVSTSHLTERPEVTNAGANVSQLVRAWMNHAVMNRWTHSNAHQCTDAADKEYLERDVTGQAAILTNSAKDVRRIGHVEHASVFLCQLAPDDPVDTRVDRDLLPHAEQLSLQDGYTGAVATKLIATRLFHAPVLIIEVSRKAVVCTSDGYVEQKLQTPVYYGDAKNVLNIHDHSFQLSAVVCHIGNNNGHYVCYVLQDKQWLFYDDVTPLGRMVPVSTLEPHASTTGELYFYTRCSP